MEPADDLTTCSDEELLGKFQSGRREAFGALVRRYQAELFGYLRRYLGDHTLAEDVIQNTFLQVFLKISQYEPGRAAKPWLYTIATHQAIDALRRQSRHQVLSIDQNRDDDSQSSLPQLMSLAESKQPSPLEQVEGEERRELVRAGVERLPDFLKQVLILAYYQGLKYSDVAEIVGIPVGTVKSRLHSALVKLQEFWAAAPSLHQ